MVRIYDGRRIGLGRAKGVVGASSGRHRGFNGRYGAGRYEHDRRSAVKS